MISRLPTGQRQPSLLAYVTPLRRLTEWTLIFGGDLGTQRPLRLLNFHAITQQSWYVFSP